MIVPSWVVDLVDTALVFFGALFLAMAVYFRQKLFPHDADKVDVAVLSRVQLEKEKARIELELDSLKAKKRGERLSEEEKEKIAFYEGRLAKVERRLKVFEITRKI